MPAEDWRPLRRKQQLSEKLQPLRREPAQASFAAPGRVLHFRSEDGKLAVTALLHMHFAEMSELRLERKAVLDNAEAYNQSLDSLLSQHSCGAMGGESGMSKGPMSSPPGSGPGSGRGRRRLLCSPSPARAAAERRLLMSPPPLPVIGGYP
ncbi:unnamed protein product [Polarella glacialis]|uniref:Uncharacterized protein n=1 Tax=Polarella glacialis TaxID=89957 RepID=A0A813JWP6_POLGL|nr:unnamed protein product [Polarella glacialis]